MSVSDFDKMAFEFTTRVRSAADWMTFYFGPDRATRIKSAIRTMRGAIEEAEKHPEIGPTLP